MLFILVDTITLLLNHFCLITQSQQRLIIYSLIQSTRVYHLEIKNCCYSYGRYFFIFFILAPLLLLPPSSSEVAPVLPITTADLEDIPRYGAHVGWTLLGTNFCASAANSNNVGHRGLLFNSIPTRWSSAGRKLPLRPLHRLQHVAAFSHVSRPPKHRGST